MYKLLTWLVACCKSDYFLGSDLSGSGQSTHTPVKHINTSRSGNNNNSKQHQSVHTIIDLGISELVARYSEALASVQKSQ